MCYEREIPTSSVQPSQEAEAVVYNYFSSDPGWALGKQGQGAGGLSDPSPSLQELRQRGWARTKKVQKLVWDIPKGDQCRQVALLFRSHPAGQWGHSSWHSSHLCFSPQPPEPTELVQLQSTEPVPAPTGSWDSTLQPQYPHLGAMSMFPCLCFTLKASEASGGAWFSLMLRTLSHDSFCNTWQVDKDNGWEAFES